MESTVLKKGTFPSLFERVLNYVAKTDFVLNSAFKRKILPDGLICSLFEKVKGFDCLY